MDIQFYGANCVTVSGKDWRLVVDDNLQELGGKPIAKDGDVILNTGSAQTPTIEPKLLMNHPGEYEVAGLAITGIEARSHMDEVGKTSATMYKVVAVGVSLLFTGHIHPELSEDHLEEIGRVDVLFVPVGGNGYTLDPVGAQSIIKRLSPKLVVPTHYADKSLNFPVPQQSLEEAAKVLGIESHEAVAKLKLKTSDLPETTQIAILEKA